jgi:hypothetical protein
LNAAEGKKDQPAGEVTSDSVDLQVKNQKAEMLAKAHKERVEAEVHAYLQAEIRKIDARAQTAIVGFSSFSTNILAMIFLHCKSYISTSTQNSSCLLHLYNNNPRVFNVQQFRQISINLIPFFSARPFANYFVPNISRSEGSMLIN